MFARSGGGGGDDDAYNFDIANSYGGGSSRGASKKRGKQSKLGKSSLSKTTGSSPSSSSFKPHVSEDKILTRVHQYVDVYNMASSSPKRCKQVCTHAVVLRRQPAQSNKTIGLNTCVWSKKKPHFCTSMIQASVHYCCTDTIVDLEQHKQYYTQCTRYTVQGT